MKQKREEGCATTWEKYFFPSTTREVVELLDEYNGTARIIAGGTDLIRQQKQGLVNVKAIVDIGAIPELNFIHMENDRILIGAAVTHSRLAASVLLREKARVLADAARSVGSSQIRNVGTIGGNVVNAQPAADTVIALLSLDACIHVLNSAGTVEKKLEETFCGPGKSNIDPSRELVTHFSFSAPGPLEKTAFLRYTQSEGMGPPLLNMGIWMRLSGEWDLLEEIRIAMGPMARVPFRAQETERFLRGAPLNDEIVQKAALIAAGEVQPRDSFRGQAAYKREMVRVFLRRAINAALEKDEDGFVLE